MVLQLYKWLWIAFLPFYTPVVNRADNPIPVTATAKVFHPFFVSVTEVAHNSKEKTLEVSCKIFADDMENVLKQNYKTAVDLTNTKQEAQNNKLINDYIVKHLTLVADGKNLPLNYVGFEKESESVYCYFEVPQVASIKKVDITNSILQDLTSDQINIIHVMVNGNRKSYKLDYPKKVASFNF